MKISDSDALRLCCILALTLASRPLLRTSFCTVQWRHSWFLSPRGCCEGPLVTLGQLHKSPEQCLTAELLHESASVIDVIITAINCGSVCFHPRLLPHRAPILPLPSAYALSHMLKAFTLVSNWSNLLSQGAVTIVWPPFRK